MDVVSAQASKIRASSLPFILDYCADRIKTLSLDCFDTLLWRKTAAPRDVFYAMQQRDLFRSLGVTAYQRIQAAAKAYRHNIIVHGSNEVTLSDIYRIFTGLNPQQQNALVEEELLAEMDACYAFTPVVELIRKAHAKGIKIIIVSDTYLVEHQLRHLLAHCLPSDVMSMISLIFCSCEYGKSKKEGIFHDVLANLAIPADSMLHLGDNLKSDFEAPTQLGIQSLHFVQFDNKTNDLLRMQHASAALSALSDREKDYIRLPRYSLFRGVFTHSENRSDMPSHTLGYMTFGPMLYAFSRFICDEIEMLQLAGKRPKVFFLLRDAYLLSRACEAYAGMPVGKCVRIRKSVTVAASFRTREDVDHYLTGIDPRYYNFEVICSQLLLPKELTNEIVQLVQASSNPESTFFQLIHKAEILQFIFEQSAAYRKRLKQYIQKEMQIESGDTIVLVDTGYIGVTQDFLTRTLSDEMEVDIVGRYLVASDEPDRPRSKGLITSSTCDHGLFEQCCTFKEGAVLDYDNEGNPIFDILKLSSEQYARVDAIQEECIQFIKDTKKFFATTNISIPFQMLQEMALAALRRHIFFPTPAEATYLKIFQHDKDMGSDLNKTMFNIENGIALLRRSNNPNLNIQPYEARGAGLDIALSLIMKKFFELEFMPEDRSLTGEKLKIIIIRNNDKAELSLNASPTYDGYFSLCLPVVDNAHIGIVFGLNYQWFQIESIRLMSNAETTDVDKNIVYSGMNQHGTLFECQSETSLIMISSIPIENTVRLYQIVFRPIIWNKR